MWSRWTSADPPKAETVPQRLRDALRQARIEAADKTAAVIDLRDADVARLDILNESLDPVFADLPDGVALFDRALSRGDTPRLWIDAIAHVEMGRDKRLYRFVQDTSHGRIVLAESFETSEIGDAVTKYVARRIVERERALSADAQARRDERGAPPGRRLAIFLLGMLAGAGAMAGALYLLILQFG